MILLATVALFSVTVAGGAALLEPVPATSTKAAYLADRTVARVEQAPSADTQPVHAAEQMPVRVIGAPFVPNTNPRER